MLKKTLFAVIILALVAVAAFFFLSNYFEGLLEPANPLASDEEVLVEISSGSGTSDIARLLENEGLIQNELAFRIYSRQQGLDQSYMAGKYLLNPSMSVPQIALKLATGDQYTETVWFTIPEGFTVVEIAARLGDMDLVDEDIFLGLAKTPSSRLLEQFPFLGDIEHPGIDYTLEGYLFPDTYEIFRDASEEEIISLMLAQLVKIIGDEHLETVEDSGYNLHEILTIASLVEREGRVDHERPRIAGVFYNRLAIGQRLESCATIQYILGETKEFLTFADLELPSPYNTYRNDGLPPGPIAAPGEASIMAALYPEETGYYFFNYKYDDSGEHYFSRTLQEHNANVQRAEENLR